MAKIRLLSYLDQGAPQYTPDERDAILKLMKMANETGYNVQYPSTLVVDANSKTIQLSFPTAHGFKQGHLVVIKNTINTVFQSSFYRVLDAPTTTTLICRIDNYNEVVYPTSDSSSTMSVTHKTLNWDVLYSTDKQYSIRSKDSTSTKNVLTLKEPSLARLKFNVASYSAPACVSAHASTNVDTSTGEILNSYTSVHNVNGVESFYWASYNYSFTSSSYTPSAAAIAANDHLLPWWVIGTEKFFYLIVGAYHDSAAMRYRSASRNNDNYILRQCYMFGDPEYLGDPSYIDMGGTLFSALYKPGAVHSSGYSADSTTPALYTESHRVNNSTDFSYGHFFLRSHDMQSNSLVPLNYSTIDYPFTSTVYSFSNGSSYMQYPHLTTRGLIFFPFYTRVHTTNSYNSLNYFRSIMPFARMCPINIQNLAQQWYVYDNAIIKSDNGKMNHCVIRYSTTGQAVFGAFINELD